MCPCVEQALVGQSVYREQGNSHLEWPDHTVLLGASPSIIYILKYIFFFFVLLYLLIFNWTMLC